MNRANLMPATEHADSPFRRRSLLLLLFALVIAIILMLLRKPEKVAVTKLDAKTVSPLPSSVEPSSDGPDSESPAPPEVIRHTIRGDFHLAPGEVAILSFWNREPDRNTLLAIEPETLPDGNLSFSISEICLSDRRIEAANGGDLFPGWLEDDRIGTTSQERLEEFLQLAKWQGDLEIVSQPRLVTVAGRESEIRSAVRNPDWPEDIWAGQLMRLTANQSRTSGGLDLELVFEKQEWSGK